MKHYRSRSNSRRSRKPKSRINRRRRTYRYRGGAAGGPAGAAKRAQIAAKKAQIDAEIAALDAAFTAALGGTHASIKDAIIAVNKSNSSEEAKTHATTLLGRIRKYTGTQTQITQAMLTANQATADTAAATAREDELKRNVFGSQPKILGTPYKHSENSKSQNM